MHRCSSGLKNAKFLNVATRLSNAQPEEVGGVNVIQPLALLESLVVGGRKRARCGRGKGYYDTFLAKCKKGQVS